MSFLILGSSARPRTSMSYYREKQQEEPNRAISAPARTGRQDRVKSAPMRRGEKLTPVIKVNGSNLKGGQYVKKEKKVEVVDARGDALSKKNIKKHNAAWM